MIITMHRTPKRRFREGRLSEHVVVELERIIAEEFPTAGQLLPKESELAHRFGVSRIVIREAVKVLEDRGVLEVQAGSGTRTRMPSPDKVKESLLRLFRNQPIPEAEDMERMLELRGVLEETAAGLAAVRASDEDLAEIGTALSEMAAATSTDVIFRADLRFHTAVARAAHNRYFEMVLEPLTHVIIQQITLTDSYHVGLDMHGAVYEAIRKRNPVAARQAVRRLIKTTLEDTKRALAMLTGANGR
jgi:GntR family transcriptional repressor for pyruvate dehydrogenase complex